MGKYGWVRSKPDHRDVKLILPKMAVPLPPNVDLRPEMPPVYNQGNLGSCTGNAIGAAYEYMHKTVLVNRERFTPSRLFIYYNERAIEGTIPIDNGAELRDGLKSLKKYGVCPEAEEARTEDPGYWWTYSDDPVKFRIQPKDSCYEHAAYFKQVKYQSVPLDQTYIKTCLAHRYPVIFGISIYDSFESPEATRTGIIHMPKKNERLLGGHALLMVGYTTTGLPGVPKNSIIFRNSWGEGWGDKGYGYIPIEYVTNPELAADFWVLRHVSQEN